MARQEINLGIVPGDKRGDKLRVGGKKINENFTELYNFLTNQQTSPVIAAYHLITYEECNQLAGIHVIVPAPGLGKIVELVSMIARITPMAPPVGGLQIYSTQTLNVTTDGDTETRDWGFFPADFIMSQSQTIQRMTPVFSTQLFANTPVYVCLSGGENPKSGSSQIELYYLYRIIDASGAVGPGGGLGLFSDRFHHVAIPDHTADDARLFDSAFCKHAGVCLSLRGGEPEVRQLTDRALLPVPDH